MIGTVQAHWEGGGQQGQLPQGPIQYKGSGLIFKKLFQDKSFKNVPFWLFYLQKVNNVIKVKLCVDYIQ